MTSSDSDNSAIEPALQVLVGEVLGPDLTQEYIPRPRMFTPKSDKPPQYLKSTGDARPSRGGYAFVPGQGKGHGPLRRPENCNWPAPQVLMLKQKPPEYGTPIEGSLIPGAMSFKNAPFTNANQTAEERPAPPQLNSTWVPLDLEEWPYKPSFWRGGLPTARRVVEIVLKSQNKSYGRGSYSVVYVAAGANPGRERTADWFAWWSWIASRRARFIPNWTRQWTIPPRASSSSGINPAHPKINQAVQMRVEDPRVQTDLGGLARLNLPPPDASNSGLRRLVDEELAWEEFLR